MLGIVRECASKVKYMPYSGPPRSPHTTTELPYSIITPPRQGDYAQKLAHESMFQNH
jgi:hypothetical protein